MIYEYLCFVCSNLSSMKFQWNLSLPELKYLISERERFRKIFEHNTIKSISWV